MSIQSVMPSNHLTLCHPHLLLLSIFPSIRVFSNKSVLCIIRWPTYCFTFSINPSNGPLGLTALISLLSKGLSRVFSSTTVRKHQFFGAQLSLWSNSHIHTMTARKTIALIIWTFVCKVMSLLWNILFTFVLDFLPRIMCLNFMAAVTIHNDFGAQEYKLGHYFHFSLSICNEVMGLDANTFVFQKAYSSLNPSLISKWYIQSTSYLVQKYWSVLESVLSSIVHSIGTSFRVNPTLSQQLHHYLHQTTVTSLAS